jgi:hypothetical protein
MPGSFLQPKGAFAGSSLTRIYASWTFVMATSGHSCHGLISVWPKGAIRRVADPTELYIGDGHALFHRNLAN